MTNRTKYGLIAGVIVLLAVLLFGASSSHSQDQQEVKPYEFADFPIPWNIVNGKIYKAVHQGCELFIVVAPGQHDPSVAIATGRGCK